MSTLALRKKRIVRVAVRKSRRRILIYAVAAFSMALTILLVKVAALPLIARGTTIPVQPIKRTATPGAATANLLADFDTQNIGAQAMGFVGHRYLSGSGTIVGFAGDNIQIFEYTTGEMARAEMTAIFKRAPRLTKENFFHLYLKDNLIGLYFGHNATVMQITQQAMGAPFSAPLQVP